MAKAPHVYTGCRTSCSEDIEAFDGEALHTHGARFTTEGGTQSQRFLARLPTLCHMWQVVSAQSLSRRQRGEGLVVMSASSVASRAIASCCGSYSACVLETRIRRWHSSQPMCAEGSGRPGMDVFIQTVSRQEHVTG